MARSTHSFWGSAHAMGTLLIISLRGISQKSSGPITALNILLILCTLKTVFLALNIWHIYWSAKGPFARKLKLKEYRNTNALVPCLKMGSLVEDSPIFWIILSRVVCCTLIVMKSKPFMIKIGRDKTETCQKILSFLNSKMWSSWWSAPRLRYKHDQKPSSSSVGSVWLKWQSGPWF